jgi:hypothetical protein
MSWDTLIVSVIRGHVFGNSQKDHSSSMAAIPSPDRFSSNLVEPLQARALRGPRRPPGVQGRQECRFGVDGGLQRRGDPHRVWPERLEQESEGAEVLLEGSQLGVEVFRQDRRHGAFEGGRRRLWVLPQPLVEDAFVGAVLVEDDQAVPLLGDERRPRCRLSQERLKARPDGGHYPRRG